MDFAKRLTKKLTGQNEKQNSLFEERNIEQSVIHGGNAGKSHLKPPVNYMNKTYGLSSDHQNINQQSMFQLGAINKQASQYQVGGTQPTKQKALQQSFVAQQQQFLGLQDFGTKNTRSNTMNADQSARHTELGTNSNLNQLNKNQSGFQNYYIQNSTVQINTGSGRAQSATGGFGPTDLQNHSQIQGGFQKIKRAVSKNFGGLSMKDSKASAKNNSKPGYFLGQKNIDDQFDNLDVNNIVYNPQQSLRSHGQNKNINFSQRLENRDPKTLTVNYQSHSNYSNQQQTNRLNQYNQSNCDELQTVQSSLRSQNGNSIQKIAYLEKQNCLLQDQVTQLQQSLDINKQIQQTILESTNTQPATHSKRNSVVFINNDEDGQVQQSKGALDELRDVLIKKNQQLDTDLQKSKIEQNELQNKILLLEQVNKGIIDQQLEHSQEQSDTITALKALVQSYEYAMDMRESYFTKLQKLSLQIAKKQPNGPFINQMQDILVKKQADEQLVEQQIHTQKKNTASVDSHVIDLTDEGIMGKQVAKPQLNLKNVIFQRDNLQEKLKYALQELDTLKSQKTQLQMQLQTFDDDEDFEKMYENFAQMDKLQNKNRKSSLGINDTVVDTDVVLQELEKILQQPKGQPADPLLLEEEDDGAVLKKPAGKPKFCLAMGGLSQDGKSKVPNLDFSNLKHVKENDWYAQCKKLEEVISKLRDRVATYEQEKETIIQSNQAQESLLRQLQRQVVNFKDQNDRLLSENKRILVQLQESQHTQLTSQNNCSSP